MPGVSLEAQCRILRGISTRKPFPMEEDLSFNHKGSPWGRRRLFAQEREKVMYHSISIETRVGAVSVLWRRGAYIVNIDELVHGREEVVTP